MRDEICLDSSTARQPRGLNERSQGLTAVMKMHQLVI